MRETRRLRREQIEAVIAGNLSGALALEEQTLRQTRRLLDSAHVMAADEVISRRERAVRLLGQVRRFKRPELLMHEIAADVVAHGHPVAARLGGEAELLARYGVSRTVFREAVRALERSGIVEMRTGRHSGLFVVAPDPTNTLSSARERIVAADLALPALIEVLAPLIAGAIGLIEPQRLPMIDGEGFRDCCIALARSSGNRILDLFTALLTSLLQGHDAALAPAVAELRAACRAEDRPLVTRIVIAALRSLENDSAS